MQIKHAMVRLHAILESPEWAGAAKLVLMVGFGSVKGYSCGQTLCGGWRDRGSHAPLLSPGYLHFRGVSHDVQCMLNVTRDG